MKHNTSMISEKLWKVNSFREDLVALKKAKIMYVEMRLKPSRHGYGGQAGCPWAWWSHAWRGWRTSWCPQTDQPSKPQMPPAGPWRLSSGSGDRSWSPGRFISPTSGRAVCGWGAQCSSGIFWSLSGLLFLVCICGVSLHLQWLGHSYEQPWWPTVFLGPCLQLIYGQSAWYEPLLCCLFKV